MLRIVSSSRCVSVVVSMSTDIFQVPCSQVLYAINGKFVSLARVKEDEVCNDV